MCQKSTSHIRRGDEGKRKTLVLQILNFDTEFSRNADKLTPDCYRLSKGRMIVQVLNYHTPGSLLRGVSKSQSQQDLRAESLVRFEMRTHMKIGARVTDREERGARLE